MLRKLLKTHMTYRCKVEHTVYLWAHYLNGFACHFFCKMKQGPPHRAIGVGMVDVCKVTRVVAGV